MNRLLDPNFVPESPLLRPPIAAQPRPETAPPKDAIEDAPEPLPTDDGPRLIALAFEAPLPSEQKAAFTRGFADAFAKTGSKIERWEPKPNGEKGELCVILCPSEKDAAALTQALSATFSQ